MNTESGLIQNHHGKRTTSVRLEHLDILEQIVRDFGFKDRSHFFQLCTDALLQAHGAGLRLAWPPRFAVRDDPAASTAAIAASNLERLRGSRGGKLHRF